MRQQFGSQVAADAARRMVVPPHRSGGQAQYIARAVPDCDAETLGPLLDLDHREPRRRPVVDELAKRSHMSPRTFARRFRDETGTTPHSWVTAQRVQAAEELLELTDHPVDWIAERGRLRQRRRAAPPLRPRPRRQPAAVPPYLHRRPRQLRTVRRAHRPEGHPAADPRGRSRRGVRRPRRHRQPRGLLPARRDVRAGVPASRSPSTASGSARRGCC